MIACAAAIASVLPSLASADPPQEQGTARRARSTGEAMSLRQIEAMWLPRMGAMQYLGPDFFETPTMIYRLKFIDDGRVVFIEVDARTGRLIRRSP